MVGYSPVSIPKKNNGGRTKPKKANLILFRLNDVKTYPTPDEKGVLIKENLVLKTGAKAFFLETTASTISVGQTSEGDPDNKGFKQKIEFSRPGSDDVEFEEFMENNVNEDLCCIIEYQLSGKRKLAGYPGNPLQLTTESTDNNEGDVNKVTLESVLRGSRIYFYEGEMPVIDGVDEPEGSGDSESV
uniref:hypothetical protein n=1 Tax=Butyricimonas virosa TaxID=544645 RepID=UPI00402A2CC3